MDEEEALSSHLCVFGCKAFAHVPKDERGKFDSKARKCIPVAVQENDIWELVDLPEDRQPVGSKWVFKAKTNADGHIEQYKA